MYCFHFSQKSFRWKVTRNETNILFFWNLKPLVTCNKMNRVVDVVFKCVHRELWFHHFNAVFFSLKNVFLNSKMSKMHVNHLCVAVDLAKIIECGSTKSKAALFFLLAKKFLQANKNDFQLSQRASCKTEFLCTLLALNNSSMLTIKQ